MAGASAAKMRDLTTEGGKPVEGLADGQDLVAHEEIQDVGTAWGTLWPGVMQIDRQSLPRHVFFGHDAKRRLQLHQYATGRLHNWIFVVGGAIASCVVR
jgi:hypothetical protein